LCNAFTTFFFRLLIGQYVTLNGDVVSHVNITTTRLEDGGEFKCVANNKLGSTAHSARLNIYGMYNRRPYTFQIILSFRLSVQFHFDAFPSSSIHPHWHTSSHRRKENIYMHISLAYSNPKMHVATLLLLSRERERERERARLTIHMLYF